MHVNKQIKYISLGILEIYYLLLRHNNIYVTYKEIYSHQTINQVFNLQITY